MVALYVTSSEKGSGKTAICAGLGRHLLAAGKKVGFFKPVISDGTATSASGDSDAEFLKGLFFLDEPTETLSPVISSRGSLSVNIKETYAKASQGKDVVIIEGISDQHWAAGEITEALETRVIVMENYPQGLPKIVENTRHIGKSLLGVILNKVPVTRMEQARIEMSALLEKAGVSLLGVLPENRLLLTMTVGELAECIQGEILSGADKSADLVENFMLGALALDPGPDYFGRKDNKAVLLKSERSDMQMAAMQTSSRCLVLAGDTSLNPMVLNTAEKKNIPIILTGDDIPSMVAGIEEAMAKAKFNQQNKLKKLTEVMEQDLDFQKVNEGLGLAG